MFKYLRTYWKIAKAVFVGIGSFSCIVWVRTMSYTTENLTAFMQAAVIFTIFVCLATIVMVGFYINHIITWKPKPLCDLCNERPQAGFRWTMSNPEYRGVDVCAVCNDLINKDKKLEFRNLSDKTVEKVKTESKGLPIEYVGEHENIG